MSKVKELQLATFIPNHITGFSHPFCKRILEELKNIQSAEGSLVERDGDEYWLTINLKNQLLLHHLSSNFFLSDEDRTNNHILQEVFKKLDSGTKKEIHNYAKGLPISGEICFIQPKTGMMDIVIAGINKAFSSVFEDIESFLSLFKTE